MSAKRGRVVVDSRVLRTSQGTRLIVTDPLRVIRLSPSGARVLDALLDPESDASGPSLGTNTDVEDLFRYLWQAGVIHRVDDPGDLASGVAIVIPVRDNAPGLARLLEALRREFPTATHDTTNPSGQDSPRQAISNPQIIVVDDASTDAKQEIWRLCRGHDVELVVLEANVGPGPARNVGAGLATSRGAETLVFVDSDVVPAPGAIARLASAVAADGVAAVAGRVVGDGGPDSHVGRSAGERAGIVDRFEAGSGSLDLGGEPAVVRAGGTISYVPAAFLAVTARDFAELGGFRAIRIGEDVDLVWRLNRTNGSVRYEPAAVGAHRSRRSVSAMAKQVFGYGRSAATLEGLHPGRAGASGWKPSVVAALAALPVGGWCVRSLALATLGWESKRIWRSLRAAGVDRRTSATLVASAWAKTAGAIAPMIRRSWLPAVLMAALVSRRARFITAVVLTEPLLRRLATGDSASPATAPQQAMLELVSDLAYCGGQWVGALDQGSAAVLVPGRRSGRARR